VKIQIAVSIDLGVEENVSNHNCSRVINKELIFLFCKSIISIYSNVTFGKSLNLMSADGAK
jgi:hypothetical protein